jgi:hypothetical protein
MSEGRVLASGAPGALVLEHLAAEAVEIEGDADAIRSLAAGFDARVVTVRSGRRTTLHTEDATALAAHLKAAGAGRSSSAGAKHSTSAGAAHLVARPSNLEDLFLHLTGSDLGGGA